MNKTPTNQQIRKKKTKRVRRQNNLPSITHSPFTDYGFNSTAISTAVNTQTMFSSIQSVLQTYPQHATPVYIQGGTNYRLRQCIRVNHLEVRIQVVGAQATTLLSADLYNSVRLSLYISGPGFQDGSAAYLTSVMNHPNILDVDQVLMDRVYSLPSQAFDSASGFNVPQVRNSVIKVPVNRDFYFYSSTSTGTGLWETEKYDLLMDVISDSSVTPHPTVQYQVRIFFSFIDK